MRLRVLVDANVLYSRTLRDWVFMLALAGGAGAFYDVLRTEDILAETVRNFRKNHPNVAGGYIADVVEKVRETFPEGRVRDYECPPWDLDAGDAHVHGAALAGEADILLTSNVAHFIGENCDPDEMPYEVYAPDEFLMLAWQSQSEVVRTVYDQMEAYRVSREGKYSLAERLKHAGAGEFARVIATLSVNGGKA